MGDCTRAFAVGAGRADRSEAGYPDLTFEGIVGIYGWRDMLGEIKDRVSKDVQAITADPSFHARLAANGSAPRTGSTADFAAAIDQQRAQIALLHQAIAQPVQ
jgi:tripartite-type tricarboxylate transporter receptor subunit TctC